MGLERGSLSLLSTTEALLGISSVSGKKSREYGSRGSAIPQFANLALTLPTSDGARSV
jgi:hypothetical protein